MKAELIHLLKEEDRLEDKHGDRYIVAVVDKEDEYFPLKLKPTSELSVDAILDDDGCFWCSGDEDYQGTNLKDFEPTQATKDYMLWRLQKMEIDAQQMQDLHDELYDILVRQPLQESSKGVLGSTIQTSLKPNKLFQYSPPVKVGDCITIGDCQGNFHESKGEVLEISDDSKFKYLVMTQGVRLWVAESKDYCQCCSADDRRVNCLYKMQGI